MTENAPGTCARCGNVNARPCVVYAVLGQGELCLSCEREVHRIVRHALALEVAEG